MYILADHIKPEDLRAYGFKPAHEWPEYENWIDNDYWKRDMFLIPMNPDEKGRPNYADEDDEILLWELHCMNRDGGIREIWIDMTPSATFHITCLECNEMFKALYNMIRDGVILEVDRNG